MVVNRPRDLTREQLRTVRLLNKHLNDRLDTVLEVLNAHLWPRVG